MCAFFSAFENAKIHNYRNVAAAWRSLASRKQARRVHALGIRCERTTEGGNRRSLDTWIGRAAMLGFVAAIGVEISTGKGVLEVNSSSLSLAFVASL